LFFHGAHLDPLSLRVPQTPREKGHRYNRGEKKGARFHVAGWIRWVEKAEKLAFYNDEDDLETHPPKELEAALLECEGKFVRSPTASFTRVSKYVVAEI